MDLLKVIFSSSHTKERLKAYLTTTPTEKIQRDIRSLSKKSFLAGHDLGYYEASTIDWEQTKTLPDKPLYNEFADWIVKKFLGFK